MLLDYNQEKRKYLKKILCYKSNNMIILMSYCKRVCGTHDYRLIEPDKYVHILNISTYLISGT